jgi:uncharacterized protein YjiS (DUF1127 family)
MTTATRKAAHSLPLALASSIGGAFNSMFERRRMLRHLEQMDDRLLRDVGLTRADVDAILYRR